MIFAYAGILAVLLHIMIRYVERHADFDLQIKKSESAVFCVLHFLFSCAVLRSEASLLVPFVYMMILGQAAVIDVKKRAVFIMPLAVPAVVAMVACLFQYQRLVLSLQVAELLLALGCVALMFVTAFILNMQGRGDCYVVTVMCLYFLYANPNYVGSICVCMLLLAYALLLVGLLISRLCGNKSWTLPFVPFLYVAFCIVVILI